MRLFHLGWVYPPRFSWTLRASSKWCLPGIHCLTCDAVWSSTGEGYPSVDLSSLPDSKKLRPRVEEDFAEFNRLRELVRPLVPEGVPLRTGATLGPLVGTGRGHFPELLFPAPAQLAIRREALEQLQAEGVRGLMGCPTELRLRGKDAPELLELQIEPRGLLHPACLPRGLPAPCVTCGRQSFTLPKEPILEAASLPDDRDLFRLANFTTVIVATERFVETAWRLRFEEVEFRELRLL
ncbi:SitI6 family double-CXXCG motif immunity protein [Pyxidicoccus xibeiensis]|uniref:SitI6 family double-CXXCG motif immunity protein n=1 Tax=Pyxidicoccus xibeiensis TaxID=2906759 RepID=UPI0020A7E452|nr:double-CXXCG motif protein [Pyxidicoccus xibeiensis]MCP3136482.1 double-CXXCG motif protein [Pyxidicoccus xibeiensis]